MSLMILVAPGWYGEYDYADDYSESDYSDVSDETSESNEFGDSAGFAFGDFFILLIMVNLMKSAVSGNSSEYGDSGESIYPGASFDFGELADSRESGDFGESVESVDSGGSHDCVEFADSEEFLSIVLSLLILVIV